MKKLILIITLLTVIGCEKELHQDISNTFLEIYSDLSRPLLSNYKFFDGVSGGQGGNKSRY